MGDKEQWMALAEELGFEFKEGVSAVLESPTLLAMIGDGLGRGNARRALALLQSPLARTILDKVFMGAATGRHEGWEFVLMRGSTSSQNRRSYTVNVGLLFKKDLGLGLQVKSSSGFLSRLGKSLFSGRYIRLKDYPDLDRQLSITARDKDGAIRLFAENNPRWALQELFAFSPAFKITDHGIRWKEPGRIIDRNKALRIMDAAAKAAEAFQQ